MNNIFTHASLCSGIGGFDLAAQWAGFRNLFYCENNSFCQRILKYHFPNSKSYEDIYQSDFTPFRGLVYVLTAGFPCQPYSLCGQRKGAEDDRYLWPEVYRTIRETQSPWIILENVAGIGSMVLSPHRTEMETKAHLFGKDSYESTYSRFILDHIKSELERESYEVEILYIPACAVDAPHERTRVWIVAYSNLYARRFEQINLQGVNTEISTSTTGSHGLASNPISIGLQARESPQIIQQTSTQPIRFDRFPTQSPLFGGDDGLSDGLDGITLSSWRNQSNQAFGNAIVPQIAYEFFQTIKSV